MASLGLLPFSAALFNLAFMDDVTPNAIAYSLTHFVVSFTVFSLWVTIRYKRGVTDAMANAFILVVNVTFLAGILLDPNSGAEGTLLGCALLAVIFNAQSFFAMGLCFPLLTAIIMAYNKSFGRPGTGHTPIVFPGAKDLEGVELFVTHFTSIV